jgi:hypothetical protein
MLFLAKPRARENFLVRLAHAEIGTQLGAIEFQINAAGKNSSKTQTAEYLLMILAMAERGDYIDLVFATLSFSVTSFVKPAFSVV